MRAKLFITVFLLAVLLIGLNWAVGRYLSSLVEQQLREIAATNDSIDYRHGSLNINPALGSVTINQFALRDGTSQYLAGEIHGSLAYSEIWRIVWHLSDNPLGRIHSFQLRAESLSLYKSTNDIPDIDNQPGNHARSFSEINDDSPTLTVKSSTINYNGRFDELLEISQNGSLPAHNHNINLHLEDITTHKDIEKHTGGLPVLSGYQLSDTLDQINLQIRYQASQKAATISTFQILSPGLTFRAGGDILFGESNRLSQPESYHVDYQLDAVTRDLARIPLSPTLGGFSMDTLSVNSSVKFDHSLISRHPFALPGHTSLYLGRIHWYPSTELTEHFGLIFGMFGLSEKQLPVRSLSADYHISPDKLHIEKAVLHTNPFDAQIHAIIATPAGQRADIIEGSATFIRTGPDFNDFVNGVENLFDTELPRKDGQLHFNFSGDPASPDFELSL